MKACAEIRAEKRQHRSIVEVGRHGDNAIHCRSGVDLIDDIDDPETAVVSVDTLIRHGSGEGALAIQKAINKTLSESPQELRGALGWQVLDPDGKMGPGTFAFFRDIANFGLQDDLRKNLKDARDFFKKEDGDRTRTKYFSDSD